MNRSLPEGYHDLEPFVARWSVSGAEQRAALRCSCTAQDRAAFYDAIKDRVVPALAALEAKPLGDLDACERRLLNLLLSFSQVAPGIEGCGAAKR